MSAANAHDAIVIGGGVGGLTAAAYLAMAGKRTIVLEAREMAGGLCSSMTVGSVRVPAAAHLIYALDPKMMTDLRLARHGLRYALRDAPTTLLREPDGHLVLTRNVRGTARRIAAHSNTDAESWPKFRAERFALARSMRRWWWESGTGPPQDETLDKLGRTAMAHWLDGWFESESLKALITADALPLSPLEPGSSLLCLWRAAQEMCGLQGGLAFPAGGAEAIINALMSTGIKAGVEIRASCRVDGLFVKESRVSGVFLKSGETVEAPLVLSSLSRRTTLLELAGGAGLGLAEQGAMTAEISAIASSQLLFALDGLPVKGTASDVLKGRLIVAERAESFVLAHADARAGRIPDDPVFEVAIPTLCDPAPGGRHVVSVHVPFVPAKVAGGWEAAKTTLATQIVKMLERHIPGLAKHIAAADVMTPDTLLLRYGAEPDSPSVDRLLAGWESRIRTPLTGLFLCGADAEPAPCVSGRAARIAASLALKGST